MRGRCEAEEWRGLEAVGAFVVVHFTVAKPWTYSVAWRKCVRVRVCARACVRAMRACVLCVRAASTCAGGARVRV